ncbi:MAG: hypothetical protein QHJ73_20065, partial [Armatimonadota bacterium]|nr:hypothetical protein [Armatimonadota bacterium]
MGMVFESARRRWGRGTLAWACVLAAGWLIGARPAAAAVYANITEVTPTELTNGVQITVKADGILKWQGDNSGWGNRIWLLFPGARSAVGKSYIDVGKFPVSGILMAIPQNAPEGIGIEMTV